MAKLLSLYSQNILLWYFSNLASPSLQVAKTEKEYRQAADGGFADGGNLPIVRPQSLESEKSNRIWNTTNLFSFSWQSALLYDCALGLRIFKNGSNFTFFFFSGMGKEGSVMVERLVKKTLFSRSLSLFLTFGNHPQKMFLICLLTFVFPPGRRCRSWSPYTKRRWSVMGTSQRWIGAKI